MRIAVVVPTYRRPRDLRRCLDALGRQTREPDRIVVVVRAGDAESEVVAREAALAPGAPPVDTVAVSAAGQVAALNAGVEAVGGADVIAITDDDACPRPDWLERIAGHFAADPRVGAVGGRDVVHADGGVVEACKDVVGKVQWFGRVIGDHHLGTGGPRDVDVLKGANLSLRREALGEGIRFDRRLHGRGAQVCNDLMLSLRLRREGWRLIYDPDVLVDHFPAQRHDADQRAVVSPVALRDAAHNETLALLEHLPAPTRAAFAVWAVACGTRAVPGLLQAARLRGQGAPDVPARLAASLRGRAEGFLTWWGSRR
jgi:cellulose synthase/poly-beta-1,6-N-acetylglucosamine synthase-like glycosyltransferase